MVLVCSSGLWATDGKIVFRTSNLYCHRRIGHVGEYKTPESHWVHSCGHSVFYRLIGDQVLQKSNRLPFPRSMLFHGRSDSVQSFLGGKGAGTDGALDNSIGSSDDQSHEVTKLARCFSFHVYAVIFETAAGIRADPICQNSQLSVSLRLPVFSNLGGLRDRLIDEV